MEQNNSPWKIFFSTMMMILIITQYVLYVLKVTSVVTWSWFIVLIPIFIIVTILTSIFIIGITKKK